MEPAKGHLLVEPDVLWQTGNCQLDCTLKTEYQYGDVLVHRLFERYKISLRTQNLTYSGDMACRMMRGFSFAMKYLFASRRLVS